jgi:hypothetical protein
VPQWLIILTGSVLVLFSVFCFGAAVWRHLYPGPPPVSDAVRIHPALLIFINSFLALVSIAALIGIWFDHVPGCRVCLFLQSSGNMPFGCTHAIRAKDRCPRRGGSRYHHLVRQCRSERYDRLLA